VQPIICHIPYLHGILKPSGHLHSTYHYTTDVLIAGAGPAGAGTSIFLSKEKILLLIKPFFPVIKFAEMP
jgi:hypothetical protein